VVRWWMVRRRAIRHGGGINSGELQLLALWCTKTGAVSSYDITTARRSCLTHLWWWKQSTLSWRWRRTLLCFSGWRAVAPRVLWRPKSVSAVASPPEARRLLQLLRKTAKHDGHGTLGFWCLRLKIGMIPWAI
jgi:hypothetical protein